MLHRLLQTALLLGFLMEALAMDAWAGEIRGTVTIKSALRPQASRPHQGSDDGGYGFGEASESTREAPPVLTAEQEIQSVVISVVGKKLPATPRQYVMHQKNKTFIPHVLPVVRGSTVLFTNEDTFFHSIYSESPPLRFSLPKYGPDKTETRTFKTPGVVELFCGIHGRMHAYVYVTENNFFAQPGKDGRFDLNDVPPGTYTVKVWHPRANPRLKTVTVPASGQVTLDVTL